ncbi:hypothetical protein [Cyclobacterium amurskyense]|uniref:hypothetical protein n=1 Tax=Cyclobacterium amurskyense TaxID=320787 RepID=UPI0030D6D192|tara:strand:- start:338 stop:1429 length:1092 start_codon:yes stop_codon:yes gene_type:complete
MIEHFLDSKTYGQELVAYFRNTYQLFPKEFCKRVIELYMGKSTDNPKFEYCYKIVTNNIVIRNLSERVQYQKLHTLLGLRKSPFIKVSDDEFLLGDKTFLIEKIYTQFINDFWFDWLQPQKSDINKPIFKMSDYRGEFGRFFENYGSKLLKDTFAMYKYSTCLALEELKYGKIEEELCDFYLRYEKRILLIEIKGGGIDDQSKYGGDLASLYKKDRDKFYKRYGVDQLIHALSEIEKNFPKVDPNLPTGKTITVYPVIIMNEKVFQTPLMAQLFNARFQEQVVNIKLTKINVKPLTLTHISDWENAEDYLFENPKKIWDLLNYHCRNKKFIPPFYNTLNRKLPKLNKGRKVVERFLNLIKVNT